MCADLSGVMCQNVLHIQRSWKEQGIDWKQLVSMVVKELEYL
jgi:hypothetical protein